jgi:hypothetical protein
VRPRAHAASGRTFTRPTMARLQHDLSLRSIRSSWGAPPSRRPEAGAHRREQPDRAADRRPGQPLHRANHDIRRLAPLPDSVRSVVQLHPGPFSNWLPRWALYASRVSHFRLVTPVVSVQARSDGVGVRCDGLGCYRVWFGLRRDRRNSSGRTWGVVAGITSSTLRSSSGW